jgi:hypothetical protein
MYKQKIILSTNFSKISSIHFMKILPMGLIFFHAAEETEITELISTIRYFCEST